jgi:hypothetical protein
MYRGFVWNQCESSHRLHTKAGSGSAQRRQDMISEDRDLQDLHFLAPLMDTNHGGEGIVFNRESISLFFNAINNNVIASSVDFTLLQKVTVIHEGLRYIATS